LRDISWSSTIHRDVDLDVDVGVDVDLDVVLVVDDPP
jgi:hypothetical protein